MKTETARERLSRIRENLSDLRDTCYQEAGQTSGKYLRRWQSAWTLLDAADKLLDLAIEHLMSVS